MRHNSSFPTQTRYMVLFTHLRNLFQQKMDMPGLVQCSPKKTSRAKLSKEPLARHQSNEPSCFVPNSTLLESRLLSKQLLSPLLQFCFPESREWSKRKQGIWSLINLVYPPREGYNTFKTTMAPQCLSVKRGATAVERFLLALALIIRKWQWTIRPDMPVIREGWRTDTM